MLNLSFCRKKLNGECTKDQCSAFRSWLNMSGISTVSFAKMLSVKPHSLMNPSACRVQSFRLSGR